MRVDGVMGSVEFDGEWITIAKKVVGRAMPTTRIRAADITGTRYKPGTRLFHGYVQFVLPGSLPATESKGVALGGRPPQADAHSLSIPRRSNDAATKLIAAVEQARSVNP